MTDKKYRSDVWLEVHLMPVRIKFQREGDEIVAVTSHKRFDEFYTIGRDKGHAIAQLEEKMYRALGVDPSSLADKNDR